MRKELLEKLIVTYLVYKSALCVCVKKNPGLRLFRAT